MVTNPFLISDKVITEYFCYRKSVTILFLLACLPCLAATQTENIRVFSPSMNKEIENTVILPSNYENGGNFPVVYLLHGYGGNNGTWPGIRPDLPELASQHEIIIVCPDGSNSWYYDSPRKQDCRYETYISDELVRYIDGNYRTKATKEGRAITGLSMGGHGAMWNAIRHQDVFGACGSTSGGVDITPFPENWDLKELLGEYQENTDVWESHTVMSQLPYVGTDLAIIFDCGTEDFFADVNGELHREMLERNIKHDYISRPGSHNNEYWNNSIPYQLLFFADYFKRTADK